MRILISGGSGLVGSRLREIAVNKGHEVFILSRSNNALASPGEIHWDVNQKILDASALEGFDAVIHLAGAGIADSKWTNSRKKEIINSRADSAHLLIEQLKKVNAKPGHFISSSAIGFYGNSETDVFSEASNAGTGFLSEVCEKWENSVKPVKELGIDLTIIRTGVVLSDKGGALPKLATPVNYLVGSPLGSGKQWVSWIHIDDLCKMYLHCLEKNLDGVYNGVAPFPETNKSLTEKIASVLNKPLILPAIPGFLLKIVLGEMATVVLEGQKVSSEKIERKGFKFEYPAVNGALESFY